MNIIKKGDEMLNHSTNTAIVHKTTAATTAANDSCADIAANAANTAAAAAETLIEKVEEIGEEIEEKQRDISLLKESLQTHSEMHAMNQEESAAYVAHLVDYSKEILHTKHDYLFTQKGNEEAVMSTLHETFSSNPYLVGVMKLFEKTDSKILRHVVGTAAVAVLIGKSLGYDSDHLEFLAKGALMHDTGKFVGYINKLANVPGDLNNEQWKTMKEHPGVSAELIDAVAKYENEKHLTVMREAARRHHVHYDKADGYPEGLEELTDHKLSRCVSIVSLSDSYDAMKAGKEERTYKENGLNERARVQFAISEVQRCRGTQFDPHTADVLLGMHKSEHVEDYFGSRSEETTVTPDAMPLADSYLRVKIFPNTPETMPETADEQVVAAASTAMDSDNSAVGVILPLKTKRPEITRPAYMLKAPEVPDAVASYGMK